MTQRTYAMNPSPLLSELHAAALERLGTDIDTLKLERAVLGIFFTGVKLTNGAGGMCATPVKAVPEAVCCSSSIKAMPIPGKIRGTSVRQILSDLYRPQGLWRSLAIATLNAVAETIWQRDGAPAGTAPLEGDTFDALMLEPGQSVALVGAFPPYLKELRRRNQPFKVLELDPSTLKPEEMPHYVPAAQAADVIPFSDVLITTGTTLINDTLDGLLQLIRPDAKAAIIGPTTTLIAEPYARRNVTFIGGARVKAPDELLDLLSEGGSGYHFFDKTVERVTLRLQG